MENLYAEVLVHYNIARLKSTLTYKVPENLASAIEIGSEVKAPLKTKKISGTVIKLHKEKPPYPAKELIGLASKKPYLQKWQISLMLWIADYYTCPLYKALELFIPKRIIRKHKDKIPEPDFFEKPLPSPALHELTADQEKALNEIINSQRFPAKRDGKKNISLIHGITGSGKTEIYLHAAKYFIEKGFQALILVPEISLTPQISAYFKKIFSDKVEIIHSRLTDTQKITAWKNIFEEHAKIIIGSRSALFAPFQNLGLIVMDEEHEFSYKQDQNPRYHARDVIMKITEFLPNLKVVFGSATPSVETYYEAKSGKINLLTLSERIEKQPLPKIEIADMREEMKKKNYSIFSETLQEEIKQTLEKNEQVILFLNRRGTNSAVICRECGYIEKCPGCDVAMTYHQTTSNLICHHCGNRKNIPLMCPICKSIAIKFIGSGTEKVEEEIKKMFPLARVIRADKDTTRKRESFKKIYKDFKNHEADILIGTQLISHGLHLPKVSLVGIMLADIGLLFPDFRAGEKTFQLLTQIAGRAGRIKRDHELEDKVIIQTYMPENAVLKAVQKYDYQGMYETEIAQRTIANYPPFSKLIKLFFSHKSEQECIKAVQRAKALIKEKANKLEINSYPAFWPKIKGKYIYNILIKTLAPDAAIVAPFIDAEGWKIDVDPISTL